jgi:hypothetical protein
MHINRHRRTGLLACALVALGGCNLDLQDPNRPTEDEVFGNLDGIKAVAIGLQAEYGNEVVDPIYVQGLVTDELGAGPNTFQTYKDVDAGTRLESTFEVASDPWIGQYEVVKLAEDVIGAAPTSEFGEGTRSGLVALGRLFKAMAFGNLIQLFERIPIDVGVDNPTPSLASREEALDEILSLLQAADAEIAATPTSTLFRTEILAPGFDLENTIAAMTARYALIAGDYALARSAAESVDLGVLSVLPYTDTDPNPLWNMWYGSGNAYQMRPEQVLRESAEPGDERVDFWVRAAAFAGANDKTLDELNQYNARPADLPVYFPDEMRLIRAEVHARAGELAEARALINEVRTQCSSALEEPVACLPPLTALQLPTQEAVLEEILRQRQYELFLQGLRYSDLRRFDLPLSFEWILLPNIECSRNPNLGC